MILKDFFKLLFCPESALLKKENKWNNLYIVTTT